MMKRHQCGIINAQIFKVFLEIVCQLILPISRNQLYFTFAIIIKVESLLSKCDSCLSEMDQVN